MRQDILGRVPTIGSTIIRAKYARTNSLFVCKVTGETKSGDPKVTSYDKNRKGEFSVSKWDTHGHVPGDFLILEGVSL